MDKGEIVTIIGANGAGKSTTLRAISRMVPADPGSKIEFNGQSILKYSTDKVVSKLGITHVPEGRMIFGNLTVNENLTLACFARHDKSEIERDRAWLFKLFPRLDERKNQLAETLSGGEQQMLAVGRAYMSGRKIMILDEPSMGLAPLLMLDMFDALKEINRQGTTILLVEQNARLALKFAPARLRSGKRPPGAARRGKRPARQSQRKESLSWGIAHAAIEPCVSPSMVWAGSAAVLSAPCMKQTARISSPWRPSMSRRNSPPWRICFVLIPPTGVFTRR